jgi:hypothetical protein
MLNTQRHKSEDESVGAFTTIVGPFGQVKTLEVRSNVGGDVPVQWNASMGEPEIPRRYRDAGWCFYSDITSGREDQTDTSPDDNERYQRMMDLMLDALKRGVKPRRGELDTEKFYHPEILRRRALERPDNMQPQGIDSILGELADGVRATPEKVIVKRGRGKAAANA